LDKKAEPPVGKKTAIQLPGEGLENPVEGLQKSTRERGSQEKILLFGKKTGLRGGSKEGKGPRKNKTTKKKKKLTK